MHRDLETKLRTMERDEAIARQLAAESQLALLESRVQPHFLFNALNSIAALIPQDPALAERMVGQVASLLRSSLDAQMARLVPLEEELRVVRAYLEVERVRFGDRLRYQVHVSNGAARIEVPPLSVQTLVENSVKYAVSPRRGGASVTVHASADHGIARVEVRDDGPGFSDRDVRAGHGLALLRSRLALLFGDRAGLRIDYAPGRTSVVMEIDDSRVPR
jgi:LytS/YehU family sensor histidine kinase